MSLKDHMGTWYVCRNHYPMDDIIECWPGVAKEEGGPECFVCEIERLQEELCKSLSSQPPQKR